MAYFSCTPGHPLGVAVINYHTHGAVGIDAAGIEWYLCVYVYICNMCSMPGIRAGCLNHQTVQNQPSWPVTTAEPLSHPSALFLTLFCDLSQTASVIHANSLQGDWQSGTPSLRTLCHANNRNKRSYTPHASVLQMSLITDIACLQLFNGLAGACAEGNAGGGHCKQRETAALGCSLYKLLQIIAFSAVQIP